MIILKNLSYESILTDINLSIPLGSRVSIIGPSGAGKSSLLRCLLGDYRPTTGTITIDGKTPHRSRLYGAGYIPQDPRTAISPRWTVEKTLRESCSAQTPRRELIKALHAVQLTEDFLGLYPAQLSGGQTQRVAIARAQLSSSPLIIADEALSALDSQTRYAIADILYASPEQEGKRRTIISVTHDYLVAQRTDYMVIMNEGRVLEYGKTESIISNPQTEIGRELLSGVK